MAQCTSLLKTYYDSGKIPDYGTPERTGYADCYDLICGGTRPAA
jgi:hypothetical protein